VLAAVAVDVSLMLVLGMIVAASVAIVAALEALEVVRVLLVGATSGISTVIAKARIERTVDVAVEGRTVVVTACADEASANKPLRTVVAVRGAVVGAVSVVAIRAGRTRDTDADGDLGIGLGSGCQEDECKCRDQHEHVLAHEKPQ